MDTEDTIQNIWRLKYDDQYLTDQVLETTMNLTLENKDIENPMNTALIMIALEMDRREIGLDDSEIYPVVEALYNRVMNHMEREV